MLMAVHGIDGVNIDFEPFKPINKKLYLCDNKFHVEPLQKLLECNSVFGFIIMDGNGRWAQSRRLPRIEGHRRGVKSVRTVVEACAELRPSIN